VIKEVGDQSDSEHEITTNKQTKPLVKRRTLKDRISLCVFGKIKKDTLK